MSVKSWFSVTEVCSNPAALTTQSCLQWCYVEPVCFVELFNILISTLFIQKKFLLTEHWTHKAINSLPSHGSLCRYTDILCRTKHLIFGDNNLLECLSFFLFSHLLIRVLTCEGKQWVTLLLSVKTQIRRMHLHLQPLQNCFPSLMFRASNTIVSSSFQSALPLSHWEKAEIEYTACEFHI